MKINNFQLKKQLDIISKRLQQIEPHFFYNPDEYIKKWDGAIKIWKFNNTYYKNIAKLFTAVQLYYANVPQTTEIKNIIPKGKTTFEKRITEDEDWFDNMKALQIQHEYIKLMPSVDAYICTDGNVLFKTSLTPYATNLYNSFVKVKGRNENATDPLRQVAVWKYFIEDIDANNYEDIPIAFIDGIIGNCRIDNLDWNIKMKK